MKDKEYFAKKGWHKLYDLDVVAQTATCAICGLVEVRLVNKSKRQNRMWTCISIYPVRRNGKGKGYVYLKHRKSICERCGFVPEKLGQLDVHHVDGNHANNDPGNLMTLCANCHRLTYL